MASNAGTHHYNRRLPHEIRRTITKNLVARPWPATLSRRARGTHALTLVPSAMGTRNAKTPRPGALAVACQMSCSTTPRDTKSSPTRARTLDLAVNSRSLYQLSYRGSGNSILIRPTAPDKYSPHAPDRSARKPQRDAEERGGNNRATQPAQIAPLRVYKRPSAVAASFSPPGTGRASGTHGGSFFLFYCHLALAEPVAHAGRLGGKVGPGYNEVRSERPALAKPVARADCAWVPRFSHMPMANCKPLGKMGRTTQAQKK